MLSKAGQGDDLNIRALLTNNPAGGGAIHVGHQEIHQHDIRPKLGAQAYGILAPCRFTHQLKIVEGQQKQPLARYAPPHDHRRSAREYDLM